MTVEEKNNLKKRYKQYKKIFLSLRKELANCNNPKEQYEILCELSVLGMEIDKMHKTLIDYNFKKFYLTEILDRFIFGKEEQEEGVKVR